MNEYSIGDYNIFSSTNSNISSNVGNLNMTLKTGDSLIKQLNSESIFMGPICDSVVNGWQKIFSDLETEIGSLKKSVYYLNDVNKNYQDADKQNSEGISNVSS